MSPTPENEAQHQQILQSGKRAFGRGIASEWGKKLVEKIGGGAVLCYVTAMTWIVATEYANAQMRHLITVEMMLNRAIAMESRCLAMEAIEVSGGPAMHPWCKVIALKLHTNPNAAPIVIEVPN